MRYVAVAVALLLAAGPACSRGGGFCATVRALNDSSGEVGITVHGDEPDAQQRIERFRARAREAADRQLELLDRLERTAPDDLRADVALVAEVSGTFARSLRDGDVGGLAGDLFGLPFRTREALGAYQRVRAETERRCGEPLGLAEGMGAGGPPGP